MKPNVTVVDKQYLTTKFVEIINADFTTIALMTSFLVFFVLLIMYGRIELTLGFIYPHVYKLDMDIGYDGHIQGINSISSTSSFLR